MKDALRWIAVLPAAILGCLWVQILNIIAQLFVTGLIMQFWDSWAGSFCFVVAGAYVAPRYKFNTAIILTLLYAILLAALLMAGFFSAVISLAGVVCGCLAARSMDARCGPDLDVPD